MKKIALITTFTFAALTSAQQASAQMPYNFSASTVAYQPLTNGTSVNGSTMWDENNTFVIPLGFSFKLNGVTTNKIALVGGAFISADTVGVQNGFGLLSSTIQDRGKFNTESPIRYTTSGTAGSRIFKLELFNVGFSDEGKNYGTLDDSLNMQVWLYEGTNAVELHYGSSRITHFNDYFGTVFMMGYLKNFDLAAGTFDKVYVLKGSLTSPTLDSMTMADMLNPRGFATVPTSGMTYKFTPKNNSTGIGGPVLTNLCKIYPTQVTNQLTIESNSNTALTYEVLSMNGASIRTGNMTTGREQLDLSILSSGMYMVRLRNSRNEVDLQKFVKQ